MTGYGRDVEVLTLAGRTITRFAVHVNREIPVGQFVRTGVIGRHGAGFATVHTYRVVAFTVTVAAVFGTDGR